MTELIDNLIQLCAVLVCGVLSGLLYRRDRRQVYFLLTCFYGCFALGLIYWTLFLLLFDESPYLFYVSDIGWISGYLFLYLIQYSLASEEERAFRCRAMWLAPLLEIPLTVYYSSIGSIVCNILVGVMILLLLRNSIRGFFCREKRERQGRDSRFFHLTVIFFVLFENGLWVSSYPWMGDTLLNPYFWFDYMLTGSLIALLPTIRRTQAP